MTVIFAKSEKLISYFDQFLKKEISLPLYIIYFHLCKIFNLSRLFLVINRHHLNFNIMPHYILARM